MAGMQEAAASIILHFPYLSDLYQESAGDAFDLGPISGVIALKAYFSCLLRASVSPCEVIGIGVVCMAGSRIQLRKAIKALEGDEKAHLTDYAAAGSEKNRLMIEYIRQQLGLTTLKYQTLEDLVQAIGLPKDDLCTHCWDGSSYF